MKHVGVLRSKTCDDVTSCHYDAWIFLVDFYSEIRIQISLVSLDLEIGIGIDDSVYSYQRQ